MLFGLAPAGLFFGAVIAALLVAVGTQLISRSSRIKEDTSLGLLFACAFSLGLVLLSLSPVRVELNHYLFGNILGLADSDLWVIYGISLVILPALVALQRPLFLTIFEPSIAASQGIPVTALNYLMMGALVLSMISSLQAVASCLRWECLSLPQQRYTCIQTRSARSSGRRAAWNDGLLPRAGGVVLAESAFGSVHRAGARVDLPGLAIIQPEIRRSRQVLPAASPA